MVEILGILGILVLFISHFYKIHKYLCNTMQLIVIFPWLDDCLVSVSRRTLVFHKHFTRERIPSCLTCILNL